MHLNEYVESVRHGVQNAAALADEHSREVATKLGAALESAIRLSLIQALADAASDISADLAPGSVELRMSGGEPQFVVTMPRTSGDEPTVLLPEPEQAPETSPGEEEPQARITLRLPQSVKEKVDSMAEADGVSTNAWLIRAVLDALAGSRGRDPWSGPPARSPLPPFPPGHPEGAFGRNFPGPGGRNRPASPNRPWNPKQGDGPGSGSVKGWVR